MRKNISWKDFLQEFSTKIVSKTRNMSGKDEQKEKGKKSRFETPENEIRLRKWNRYFILLVSIFKLSFFKKNFEKYINLNILQLIMCLYDTKWKMEIYLFLVSVEIYVHKKIKAQSFIKIKYKKEEILI